jgi:four helix bundle protein
MAAIKNFRDLMVYRRALAGATRIFITTRAFPREELYSLTDQVRRSSRAVSAMIAEGWGRRRYPSVLVNKMNEAMAEANETQAWLDHALACGYISPELHAELDDIWLHVGAMLTRMIQRADEFRGLA